MKRANLTEYRVRGIQLESIDKALDTVMLSMHALQCDLVCPEAVASALSLAHNTISDVLDEVRGENLA